MLKHELSRNEVHQNNYLGIKAIKIDKNTYKTYTNTIKLYVTKTIRIVKIFTSIRTQLSKLCSQVV